MIAWFEKHHLISMIITIIIGIAIFYISSLSFGKGAPGPEFPLKSVIYHFLIFAIFAFFLLISLTKGKTKNRHFIMIAMLLAIAYGIADELHQFFVPNRYSSLNDALVNSLGIMISGVFYSFRMRINGKGWQKVKIVFNVFTYSYNYPPSLTLPFLSANMTTQHPKLFWI